jgi:hypothetical protein
VQKAAADSIATAATETTAAGRAESMQDIGAARAFASAMER